MDIHREKSETTSKSFQRALTPLGAALIVLMASLLVAVVAGCISSGSATTDNQVGEVTKEIPFTVEAEVTREVFASLEVEVTRQVPYTVEVEVTREVPVTFEVEVTRQVPYTVEVEVTREVPVTVIVEREVTIDLELSCGNGENQRYIRESDLTTLIATAEAPPPTCTPLPSSQP